MSTAATEPTVPYTMALPDGRTVFITLPRRMTRRDRDGSLLLKPDAIRRLDRVRALAMRTPASPSPAYIRTIREALNLTQPQFAQRLGYSTISIKKWEAGTLKPGPNAVRKLQTIIRQAAGRGVVLAA